MTSPAVAVASLLANNGFGNFPSDYKWSINVGAEPDLPLDGCITIYDTGGQSPDTDQLDRRPTFQIRVRALGYTEGHAYLEAIGNFLQEQYGYTFESQRFASFEWDSDILSLGRDDRNAYLFTLNFRCFSLSKPPPPPPHIPEVQAIFDWMLLRDVLPGIQRRNLIESTVESLIAAGIWSDLDVLYMMAAHDPTAALVNWKSPGDYTLEHVFTPIFETNRGYTGDPLSGGRLRTHFTASLDAVRYQLLDASAWVWWTAGAPNSLPDFGDTTTPRTAIRCNSSGDALSGVINGTNYSSFGGGGGLPGLVGIQRTTATHQRLSKDGASVGEGADSALSVPTFEWYVCGRAQDPSNRQLASVAWGASLDGKEAAFYGILASYMSAVGVLS